MKEISDGIGVTERQVHRIVTDLAQADMLDVNRSGRCNFYSINPQVHMRHPLLSHLPLQKLLQTLHMFAAVLALISAGSLIS
jgi:hypothetical protein